MAKQLEGVYDRVLECAKEEFLEKGFTEASLRKIAQDANTSTGSIYTRFNDKSGLFEALVDAPAKRFKEIFLSAQVAFDELPGDLMEEQAFDYAEDHFFLLINHIYNHFDAFKLILTCSEGTPYSRFIHELVEYEVSYSVKFINSINNDALSTGRTTLEMLHIISSAFFSGFFEIVIHDMAKESALNHVERLKIFFQAGWRTILD